MVLAITIKGILGATALILVTFIVVILIKHSSKDKHKRNLPYLYRESWIAYCGLFILILCIFAWVNSFIVDGSLGLIQMFLITPLPLILGLYCFLSGMNWRINVYEDRFVYQNIFRKKREFKYCDINRIRPISVGGYQLVIGKAKITIDIFVSNTSILEQKIEEHFKNK